VTSGEAAAVAVRKFGAPADIAKYVWVRAGDSRASIPLAHADISPEGTLRVGWDSDLRFALYSWEAAP
jgi:hypothetical protein